MRNVFERAIGAVAPHYALARAHAHEALRAYDGAAIGRRRTGFGSAGGSANVGIGIDLARLRDRSRAMVRNTGNGWAMVDVLIRNLVGTGIRPLWNTGSDRIDNKVSSLWDYFVGAADVEGETHFYAQQELAVRSMVEGGETITRFVDLRLTDDRRMPMRLQILEGDLIDSSRDGTTEGRRVRLGVGLGDHNRRLGYYLFPEHPGERIALTSSAFIDREAVRHLYRALRPGQLRGVPWLAPVLMSGKDYADLLQFTIVKAQVAASFAGYIENQQGMASPLDAKTDAQTGDKVMMPEPGSLYNLKPGQKITFPTLADGGQFDGAGMAVLRTMAAGVGLTYDQATGDLRQANYSSLRAGKIEHRRFVEQVQHNCIIPRLCNPVADRFIDRAIMAGSLAPRADGYPREWVPPANEPIDPVKDLSADIDACRAGRMSPQEFIAQWGNDWRKVIADTKAFWAAADKAKLALDIDPRRPRAGAAAAPMPSDPPASDAPTDPAADSAAAS